jgi:hypothetical protein
LVCTLGESSVSLGGHCQDIAAETIQETYMNVSSKSQARVIAEYQAPYLDPIVVSAGDEITIDRSKKTDLAGWVWCTNRAGKSGWVPEAYIQRRGDLGYMRCDYDAIELTIQVGELLTLHKAESGFFWATNQADQDGWVPSTHVELCD